MFNKTLLTLTCEQKAELRAAGVTDQMRSDWLHNRRNPTEAELLMLEHVAGVPVRDLLIEVAARRYKPKNRALLAQAVGGKLPARAGGKPCFRTRLSALVAYASARVRRRTGGPL